MDSAVNRDLFLEKLNELIAGKREDNCFYFSQEKYSKILSEVVSAKTKCNTPLDYRRLKRFDVLKSKGEEKLVVPLKPGETNIQYYVTNEELFSILYETHTRTGHGGRTRMLKELQVKYKNITYEVVMLYLNLCKQCQMKHSAPKKGIVVKPMDSSELNSICQVDLIDLQSNRDGVEDSPLEHGEFDIYRYLKMSTEKISCPICNDEFPPSIIESHASKCLFLNESANTVTGTSKEPSKSPGNKTLHSKVQFKSPVLKKPSHSTTKRKSNSEQISSLTESEYVKQDIIEENNVERPYKKPRINKHVPLAEQMRPTSFSGYVGQDHVLGSQTILFKLLHKGEVPNIILWGPPGCGKTSLANVIANICKSNTINRMRYIKLSAAMAGVNDLKEAINVATNELRFGRRSVIFMDEIHRFSKTQQDVFLPHVESGTITLIGATTENPSFSLNSALLSRCRVVVLEKLSISNLASILKRALSSLGGTMHIPSESKIKSNSLSEVNTEACGSDTSHIPRFIIDEATINWLAETSDGDARIALGGLELAVQSKALTEEEFMKEGPELITLNDVKESLKKTHMLYDKKGDQHYDMISALHKSVRASDENASLYWLTRMIAGGEDPVYIARRLVRMASEDVGLEDPKALNMAVDTMSACKMIGMPECDVLLAQCTTYLARAPKSRLMEDALRAAQSVVANHKGPQPGIPLHLRNAHTKLMKNLGYGKGYNMLNKNESGLNYLPEGLENVDFFIEDESNMS